MKQILRVMWRTRSARFGPRRHSAAVIATMAAGLAGGLRAQDAGPPAPFPPPGRLVDVGGWRLHLNCSGTASPSRPTVILEAGIGDFSVEWSLVQPEVAKFGRVCSYDRAGDGWSDLGPHPRTMHQIVYELRTLLDRAGERPPYLLVGHSYGGWIVRYFAALHPAEVAGVVLVEGGADDPLRMMPDGSVRHSSELASDKTVPAVNTTTPLRLGDIPPGALAQIRSGLAEAARTANEPPRDRLPPEARQMRSWALGRVEHVVAAVNPFELEELAELRAIRARGEHGLTDLPLVVLTRGVAEETGPEAVSREEEHRREHAAVAALSRRGKLVVASRSGHHIQLEEPGLVVGAIREVLTSAERRSPPPE